MRHGCRLPRILVLSAVLSVPAFRAQASPIEYTYSGVIDSAAASTGVAAGTRFSGTFTYDPDVKPPGLDIEGHHQYGYGFTGQPGSAPDGSGLTLMVGDQTVLPNPLGVEVSVDELEYAGQWGYKDGNGQPAGPSTTVSVSNNNINNSTASQAVRVSLNLTNPTQSVFGSLDPPQSLRLGDFPVAKLNVTEFTYPGSMTLYTGTIDTLTAHPVPEPGVVAFFVVLGGAIVARSAGRAEATS